MHHIPRNLAITIILNSDRRTEESQTKKINNQEQQGDWKTTSFSNSNVQPKGGWLHTIHLLHFYVREPARPLVSPSSKYRNPQLIRAEGIEIRQFQLQRRALRGKEEWRIDLHNLEGLERNSLVLITPRLRHSAYHFSRPTRRNLHNINRACSRLPVIIYRTERKNDTAWPR